MRGKILGSALIAALLPGAAGATGGPVDGAPAAAGVYALAFAPLGHEVYLLQRSEPSAQPLALVIVNDHDVVVVDAGGSAEATAAVIDHIRSITEKPVSVVVDLGASSGPGTSGAVYRSEFPGVLVRSPQDELTLFRGPRTIHLTSLVVWLPEEGIVVNRDLVPALTP